MTSILPSPSDIPSSKVEAKDEVRARVRALGDEETRLVNSINILRDEENNFLRRKKDREEIKSPTLDVKKIVLEKEVSALEARKAEALKPVDEVMRQANVELEKARAVTVDQQEWEKVLRGRENELRSREEDIKKSEEEAERKSAALSQREANVATAEEEVSKQAQTLAEKAAAHAVKVADDDQEMAKREEQVRQDQRVIEIASQKQRERDAEQDDREKNLRFRFSQVQESETEINRRKHAL